MLAIGHRGAGLGLDVVSEVIEKGGLAVVAAAFRELQERLDPDPMRPTLGGQTRVKRGSNGREGREGEHGPRDSS